VPSIKEKPRSPSSIQICIFLKAAFSATSPTDGLDALVKLKFIFVQGQDSNSTYLIAFPPVLYFDKQELHDLQRDADRIKSYRLDIGGYSGVVLIFGS